MTSSMVVSPRATRVAPLRRRVCMPSAMAAARTFAAKLGGEAEAREADVNCGDLEAVPPDVAAALAAKALINRPTLAGDVFRRHL